MRRWFLGLCLVMTLPCCAQEWTVSDSLRLQRWLEQEGEIQVSPLPELDVPAGRLLMDADKPWLEFDTTLPRLEENRKPKVRLTLHPYSTTTRYDYDPVYQRKIIIDKDTWRNNPMAGFQLKLMARVAKEPAVKPSGIDLMTVFTKDFWRVRARAARQRTMQVLKDYGR